MHAETKYIIDKLNLIRLVDEGGYYRETYRSNQSIHISSCDEVIKDDVYHYSKLEENSSDIRAVSTLIYYLLDSDQFSAFHKVRFDEIWHFYKGSSVSLYVLTDSEKLLNIQIGNDMDKNENFQCIIRGNTWFGAEINNKSLYSLIGCSVSPGFDFKDFELGERDKLKKIYPQHEYMIDRLTRK